ncbi:MAG TPA: hypothetical protein VI039_12450 [Solirubrobacterales bacterium]
MVPQLALTQLEAALEEGCRKEHEWPAQVSAGLYAGVEFAIANPDVIEWLAVGRTGEYSLDRYQTAICRLSKLLKAKVPVPRAGLPPVTEEALIGGVIGLVGEQLRTGKIDRLRSLRPELVLLTLLPYVGFEDARSWANRAASGHV